MIKTEKELIRFLEIQFPVKEAEKWDFVGYSVKNKNQNKQLKILTCLDVNFKVVNKAIMENFSLIISFHPFKFAKTWKEVPDYSFYKLNLIKKLKEHKINVYSIHTNFEKYNKSINYWLIKKLELENQKNKEYKFAFKTKIEISFLDLIHHLKSKLKINNIISNIDNESFRIKSIYFSPGAGDVYEFINKNTNSTILITSDIKWNEQQLLNNLDYKFIIIPHKIEEVFNDAICSILKKQLDESIIIESIYFNDFMKGY